MKVVKLVQGLWCDHGKHLISPGDKYVVTPSGLISCPQHADAAQPETALAGSLA